MTQQGFSEYGDGLIKIQAKLNDLRNRVESQATLTVGWDTRTNYPDGTPVGKIAAVQEYGAVINHPGGTAYAPRNGSPLMQFLSHTSHTPAMGVTGAHMIRIPPRPFIRPAIGAHKSEWVAMVRRDIEESDMPLDLILERLGLVVTSDIQSAIKAVTSPPLAPSTRRSRLRRGSDNQTTATKPLVDTGLMLRSIRSEVTITTIQTVQSAPSPQNTPSNAKT